MIVYLVFYRIDYDYGNYSSWYFDLAFESKTSAETYIKEMQPRNKFYEYDIQPTMVLK